MNNTGSRNETQVLCGSFLTLSTDEMREAGNASDQLNPTDWWTLCQIAGYEQGRHGHARVKSKTLAAKRGCSVRTIERAISRLHDLGLLERTRRRMRWMQRQITRAGHAVLAILRGEEIRVSDQMTVHLSDHNGKVNPCQKKKERLGGSDADRVRFCAGSADPQPCDPHKYTPRVGGNLSRRTWDAIADWMQATDGATSYARCKLVYRAAQSMINVIHRASDWGPYARTHARQTGHPICPDDLFRLAVQDAQRSGARFGTVESAMRYIATIVMRCVDERRLPGHRA